MPRHRLTRAQRLSLLVFYGVLQSECAGQSYGQHLYMLAEHSDGSCVDFITWCGGPQRTGNGSRRVERILRSWDHGKGREYWIKRYTDRDLPDLRR